MNNFADIIPDLGIQLGISDITYLDVAINQSRYYGYEETAEWFEYWKERFARSIREEWYVVGDPEATFDPNG